ncbi:MAG: hypothetical protein O2917_00600 [Acidobacteria bacterium]|nr:hypothetical protein [Acidobacteriota bacterium]
MLWWRSYGAGLLLGCLVLVTWRYSTQATEGVVMNFSTQVAEASLVRPSPETFSVAEARVGRTAMPAIAASGASRMAWDLTIPEGAWVEANVALPADVATTAGEGVLFRIGISFDDRYEEVITHVVTPVSSADHHQWTPVGADLSIFAGRRVSLIFNTAGPGLWGAPRLVVR